MHKEAIIKIFQLDD